MGDSQRILSEKAYVNPTSVFLPDEFDALVMVAEQLCHALPDTGNPFKFGIGTRRLAQTSDALQLELALHHVKLRGNQDSYPDDCRRMLKVATHPMSYLAKRSDNHDYCDPHEDALKNGVIVFNNQTALASIKDEGGWFIMGLEFEDSLSLVSDTFAVAFLTSIAGVIYELDENNDRLRTGYYDFLVNCRNWSIESPERMVHKWLSDNGVKNFTRQRYERHGPRRFFG